MRKLHEIAREIQSDWHGPYFGAVPYIQAMRQLETVNGYVDGEWESAEYEQVQLRPKSVY